MDHRKEGPHSRAARVSPVAAQSSVREKANWFGKTTGYEKNRSRPKGAQVRAHDFS
jgi:hypothetical protein